MLTLKRIALTLALIFLQPFKLAVNIAFVAGVVTVDCTRELGAALLEIWTAE